MSLPRALEKLDDRAMQPLPPHKLTIGIFSKLWRSEKSASLIVEALYSGVKKILRRSCDVANRPFPGFFPLFLCAVAQAARLEKSHNRLTCSSAVRGSLRVGVSSACWPGLCDTRSDCSHQAATRIYRRAADRTRPGAERTRKRLLHRAGGNRCPASRSGFDRIAGLSELFRMGVWRLSRTSRTAPYWSGRNRS